MLPSSQVVVASVEDSLEVSCSRGVRLVADKLIGAATAADAGEYDMVALPVGGLVWVRASVSVRARDTGLGLVGESGRPVTVCVHMDITRQEWLSFGGSSLRPS
jgi:hypothetical protein